ncbi:MAG TPA: MYXO-CTERM sorting domain-containing protein [Polyangiaceae bacterium]|nr:MYXO-CTERM sorting domain-containing protein [Polyangiaceae bacterium]
MFARKVLAFPLAFQVRSRAWQALFVCLVLLLAHDAAAAGSAKLKTPEVQEVSGAWHLFVTIDLPKPPPIAHVPMRFVFTKTAVYERSLTDASKDPVLNRQALSNQQPTAESLDVDFANPQGKIFKGTNFDFGLTRVRGYEAGEYMLQIRTADGIDIGGAMRLVLKGDNPVVDRRSITFEAKKSGITKVGDDAGAVAKNTDDTPATNYSGDVAPSGSAAPFVPQSAYQPTDEEKIKDNPKGCGCSVPGLSPSSGGLSLLLSLGAIAGLSSRRRRRKSKAR